MATRAAGAGAAGRSKPAGGRETRAGLLYGGGGGGGGGGDGGDQSESWHRGGAAAGRMSRREAREQRESKESRSASSVVAGSAAESAVVYRDAAGGFASSWCGCMSRSGVLSPPPVSRNGLQRGAKKLSGSGEIKGGGDIGALVKSFSGGFERGGGTPGGSPFRPRLSPGKVSPLVEVIPPAQAAPAAAAMAPAVFSMSNYLSAGKQPGGVSSSPPVDKIKASPTLFEMMTHEQELQGPKPLHTISLSQQLTFQEKMKTILAGINYNIIIILVLLVIIIRRRRRAQCAAGGRMGDFVVQRATSEPVLY